MVSGFFLGGAAEGIAGAQERGLKERTLQADIGLRGRGLDIQQAQLDRLTQQDAITRADALVANTMAEVGNIIKQLTAVGRSPEEIEKLVAPLVASAKPLAAKFGRDPNALDAQVRAQLTQPGMIETAKITGTAEAAKTRGLIEGLRGKPGEPGAAGTADIEGFITDPARRADVENKLRDDYTKLSKDFIIMRDFKDRMDNTPATGAGDIGLIFSFMKILDPTSVVREGEFATARNAPGVPSAVAALWNKAIGEGQLNETGRQQFREAVNAYWKQAATRQSSLSNQFARIARRQGLNVNNVIIDFTEESPQERVEQGFSTTPGGIRFKVLP